MLVGLQNDSLDIMLVALYHIFLLLSLIPYWLDNTCWFQSCYTSYVHGEVVWITPISLLENKLYCLVNEIYQINF